MLGRSGPDTPILQLPPDFAKNTPKVEIHKISEYDNDGPFFAWNWMVLGEHSGTHFDAPHHWITGKDYADGYTDTLDVNRLVAPVNVIDCSTQTAEDEDFLLTSDHIKAWEKEHGDIGEGEWVVMRTDWDSRANDEDKFLNADDTGPHSPGPTPDAIEYLLSQENRGLGNAVHRDRCGAGGGVILLAPTTRSISARWNWRGAASLSRRSMRKTVSR
ncbi:cyclase family protein [Sulfitobacter sp. S190]|uniref:cyclase family protein n=1 Tax=Sulfitobacter sp. S190 TaxID=2867022 RepID=UPI0038FCF6D4